MKRSKLLIFSFVLALAAIFFLPQKTQAFDDSYLKGRAIQLANFSADELVVEPKLIYNLIHQEQDLSQFSQNSRIVSLLNPKYAPGGISAVFIAPKYTIIDQSRTYEVFSFKRRVGDLIVDGGGAPLAKEDIVYPERDALAPVAGNLIKITRVSEAEIEELQPVPYQTKKIDDPNLNKGTERVKTAGKNGQKRLTYLVRRENGVETSRNLISTQIITEPQDQIVSVGTKPVITGWCKFNDDVLAASIKNNLDPNALCALMKKESNGNVRSVNPAGPYSGLFQYTDGFWADASRKAGFAGASIFDAKAQIYVTAWALTHGYAGRW